VVQSPERGFIIDGPNVTTPHKRIILLRHAATISSEENLLPNSTDEPCSSLGEVQAIKTGEFLMDSRIDHLMVSPAERAVFTASKVAKCQSLTGDRAPRLEVTEKLADITVGAFSGRDASEVCCSALYGWRVGSAVRSPADKPAGLRDALQLQRMRLPRRS
jgi:broad specificity phosphatase PhoE